MKDIDILRNLIDDLEFKNKEEVLKIIKSIEDNLNTKKYGLVWEEKVESVKEDLKNNFIYLTEDKNKKILKVDNNTENLLIEGDNLESLMALQYTHRGRIDVIYIDPPYNTGNKDFKYNDNYIDKDDNWRHSCWLSFMYKRLKLAKELLSEKGIIFISIDDNEFAQLTLLCDEIFRENNRLGIISVVNNLKGRSDDKFFATSNEFLLVYAKNINEAIVGGLPMTDDCKKEYKFKDSISNYKEVGLRKTGKNSKRKDRPNMYYPIYFNSETQEIYTEKLGVKGEIEIYPLDDKGNEGCWRWGKDTFNLKKDTEIIVRLNNKNKWNVYTKMRDIVDGEARTQKAKTTWINPKYDSGNGTSLIKDLFYDNIFTNPKPLEFILDILRISTNKNSIILDFFAGSGTLGHAVLQLNKEDGGNRQFILCTNNEKNICEDVTYQRINKVINGFTNLKEEFILGIPGNLRYYKTQKIEKTNNNELDQFNLLDKTLELIQIKENAFNVIKPNDYYTLLNNNDKIVGLYLFGFINSIEIDNMLDELIKSNKPNKIAYIPVEDTSEIYNYIDDKYVGLVRFEKMPKELIEIYNKLNKN